MDIAIQGASRPGEIIGWSGLKTEFCMHSLETVISLYLVHARTVDMT